MIRHADEDDSVNTYRNIASGQISAAANNCAYEDFYLNAQSILDNATNNTTIVYNNAGVPTTTVVDLNNTTQVSSGKINFIHTQFLLELRNNWSVPVNLHAFKYFCKDSTGSSLITDLGNDLSNKGITSGSTDVRCFPWDCNSDFTRHWKMYQHQHHLLMPGEELTIKLSHRAFKYDIDNDTEDTYLKRITLGLLLRIQGVVAHDTTTHTDVGYQPCRLDFIYRENYKFTAELDRNFKFLYPATQSNLPEETGGFVTNNMDVESNLRS